MPPQLQKDGTPIWFLRRTNRARHPAEGCIWCCFFRRLPESNRDRSWFNVPLSQYLCLHKRAEYTALLLYAPPITHIFYSNPVVCHGIRWLCVISGGFHWSGVSRNSTQGSTTPKINLIVHPSFCFWPVPGSNRGEALPLVFALPTELTGHIGGRQQHAVEDVRRARHRDWRPFCRYKG